MTSKFPWITIETKTEIIAVAAFLISIGSLVGQLLIILKGSDITLYPPEQILIKSHDYPDGKSYVRLSAIMTYMNNGNPGYNDTIRKEKVFFTLNGRQIEFIWDDFISSEVDGNQIVPKRISDALPVQVDARSVVVHETYFAPWPSNKDDSDSNFIEWEIFMNQISKLKFIVFTFYFESFSGQKDEVRCKVEVDEFIRHLKQKGWSAPACKECMDS